MINFLLRVAYIACIAIAAVVAIPTISVKGSKFFAGGQQFFLKGLAYQGTPADPLIDTAQCKLDAKAMQTIGTNSIRVYHVDPYVNHDGCMAAFEDSGIYVWIDLDTFNTTIIQSTPWWTETQFLSFKGVMDAFQHYNNLAGFWIGNEVITSKDGSASAPYIKAAVADMKSYISAKKYRQFPIGYSAADIAELRPMLQNYLVCGSDSNQSIDFFGLNSYEWCGDATYETSGYRNLQELAEGYPSPMFFSETGCNVGGDRTFNDQKTIFGEKMSGTWSGSIIYEWVEETNKYGMVNYPNGQIYSGAPTPIQPDYDNLSKVWKMVSPSSISKDSYTPTLSAPACPAPTGGWLVNGAVSLPTLGSSIIQAAAAQTMAQILVQSPETISSQSTATTESAVVTGKPKLPEVGLSTVLNTTSKTTTQSPTTTKSSSLTPTPSKSAARRNDPPTAHDVWNLAAIIIACIMGVVTLIIFL